MSVASRVAKGQISSTFLENSQEFVNEKFLGNFEEIVTFFKKFDIFEKKIEIFGKYPDILLDMFCLFTSLLHLQQRDCC